MSRIYPAVLVALCASLVACGGSDGEPVPGWFAVERTEIDGPYCPPDPRLFVGPLPPQCLRPASLP